MRKWIGLIGVSLLVLFGLFFYYRKTNVLSLEKKVLTDTVVLTTSDDFYHPYEVQISYPITSYEELNAYIENRVKEYLDSFLQSIKGEMVQLDQTYTFSIQYESYLYRQFLSYVFTVSQYTGGAHPNQFIWTVVFDTLQGHIISLSDLEAVYPNLLAFFSKYTRQVLNSNPAIVNFSMMMEGTKPTVSNFSRFVFSQQGLILFFEQYQVAPYSSGEFQVVVPYSELKMINRYE